ncbi:MAG: phage holin family protein [Chloroflexi bacterium]|nr:phage holin family protein [Chloroflexota bacterium]
MNRFFIRWAINAIALYAAINLAPGIQAQTTHWAAIFGLALIFGLLNALLRPLLQLLTCPLIFLTLGLFTLLINTLMFYLAGVIGAKFGIGFQVAGFWSAFWGGVITSLVSIALNLVFKEDREERK